MGQETVDRQPVGLIANTLSRSEARDLTRHPGIDNTRIEVCTDRLTYDRNVGEWWASQH